MVVVEKFSHRVIAGLHGPESIRRTKQAVLRWECRWKLDGHCFGSVEGKPPSAAGVQRKAGRADFVNFNVVPGAAGVVDCLPRCCESTENSQILAVADHVLWLGWKAHDCLDAEVPGVFSVTCIAIFGFFL